MPIAELLVLAEWRLDLCVVLYAVVLFLPDSPECEGDILNISHALITEPDRLTRSCWLVLNLQCNA